MIIRIESQFNHPRRIMQAAPRTRLKLHPPKEAVLQGWIIIAGLTVLFLLWMMVHAWYRPLWLATMSDTATELLNLLEAASAFTLGFLWLSLWWRRRVSRRLSE